MSDAQNSVRKTYGRGFFDGLRKAGVDPDDYMNPARLAEMENSVTMAARKVLDCVPISETWTGKQIHLEMTRQGRAVDRSHVDGCLAHLKEKGLVREPEHGVWIRISAKTKPALVPVNPSIMPRAEAEAAAAAPTVDPLDRMANIAHSLRDLAKVANNLATEIDAAALDVETRIEAAGADGKKLRQLQELLKGLG